MSYSTGNRCVLIGICIWTLTSTTFSMDATSSRETPAAIVNTNVEPMAAGKFEPTWQSLSQYATPDWFRDAKFGIWAHWGPQCQPEQGDWYARDMYIQGHPQNKYHVEHYGHPSKFGFKDVIREFKAEKWDPAQLMALYRRAGAQYFVALANHHDNFDLWDSKHHAWNATRIGPRKDLIAGWAKAARDEGLKFGVSVHAAHAWMWYETAQASDKDGPLAGVAYDGKLTRADGTGKWWEGLDPQELYAQNHPLSQSDNTGANWNWGNGCSQPDQAYCQAFYDRTVDLINQANPDLVYFDDTALPLWPVSDAGLKIAAHFYNSNMAEHGGKLEAVLFGKILDEQQRRCLVWDIERGQSDRIEPLPWQTDTCIGGWHYDRNLYDRNGYKSAATVIHTLCDVVSKNGNLLLSIPVRADGTIDEKERKILEEIATWMEVNRDAIFGTRPWRTCGEGPQLAAAAPLTAQGFNEGKGKPATADDLRFTTKGDTLFVIALGVPASTLKVKSLKDDHVADVSMLGRTEKIEWSQSADGLEITPPQKIAPTPAVVFKVTLKRS
jgi:alpha-L-fucosidase